MFWYKLYAMHGGGHQAEKTEYVWSEYKLTEDEEKYRLAEWCSQFSNVKGELVAVDLPPKEELEKLLNNAELGLACAEHNVSVLRNEMRYLKFCEEEKLP